MTAVSVRCRARVGLGGNGGGAAGAAARAGLAGFSGSAGGGSWFWVALPCSCFPRGRSEEVDSGRSGRGRLEERSGFTNNSSISRLAIREGFFASGSRRTVLSLLGARSVKVI